MPYNNTRSAYHAGPNMRPRGSMRGGNRPNAGRRRTGQYIDPARFVRVAQPKEAMHYTPTHAFADFDIHESLKHNLEFHKYTQPTPIQDQTIPLVLDGKDVIGIASTGTGKTAAFAVPILNRLLQDRQARALVVAPTRELAQQIEAECRKLSAGNKLYSAVLIGGSNMNPQLRDLRGNPQLVIGTPGRIKDHIERRTLRLQHFSIAVLDEVDRMLDMGFVNDVRSILAELPNTRQSLFFSATLNNEINTLIRTFSADPITISLKQGETSDNVHQDVIAYQTNNDKLDKLHNILIDQDVSKVIVFEETKRGVDRLNKELLSRGFQADSIHGGKTQGQRQRALSRFKRSEIAILVATDVAARGIDVADISHVINYSMPQSYDDYVHRIGRAGRAGKVGFALTFVNK